MHNFMSNMRFTVLWVLGTIAAIFAVSVVSVILLLGGSFAAVAIWGENVAMLKSTELFLLIVSIFSVIGLVTGCVFGAIQKSLLRSRTNDPWRGWIIASAIGGLIGVDVLATVLFAEASQYIIWLVLPPPDTLFWVGLQTAIIPLGCLGLAQSVVLWRYVYGAWTWVLANIVAGLVVFGLAVAGATTWVVTPIATIGIVVVILATPGIVTAFAMVWLINTNWRQV